MQSLVQVVQATASSQRIFMTMGRNGQAAAVFFSGSLTDRPTVFQQALGGKLEFSGEKRFKSGDHLGHQ